MIWEQRGFRGTDVERVGGWGGEMGLQLLGVGASLEFWLMRCSLCLQMRSARWQTPPDTLLIVRRLGVFSASDLSSVFSPWLIAASSPTPLLVAAPLAAISLFLPPNHIVWDVEIFILCIKFAAPACRACTWGATPGLRRCWAQAADAGST